MKYNNKEIYYLHRNYWEEEITISHFPYDFCDDVMFNAKSKEFVTTDFKNLLVNIIEENSILYFGKTSKFPRYKIKDLPYGRCIKVDKSQYQVIGDINYSTKRKLYLFENPQCYHCVFNLEDESVNKSKEFKLKDKIKYIETRFNTTFKEILEVVGCCSKLVWEDLSRIINKEFTKCIKDEDLDRIINRKMENLTKDDVDLLYDMLNSSDKASIDLGLQMLVGYDVSAYPCTVRLLLRNINLKEGKAWNSTGVKQVRKTIGFHQLGWNLQYKDYYAFDNYKNINDHDKELSYYLWSKIVIKATNKELESFNLPDLKFKCHVE